VTFESAGNVLRARVTGWFEHLMFKGPDTDINPHAFSAGAAEMDRMLLFRDWLRNKDAVDQARSGKANLAACAAPCRRQDHDCGTDHRSRNPGTGRGPTPASRPCDRPSKR